MVCISVQRLFSSLRTGTSGGGAVGLGSFSGSRSGWICGLVLSGCGFISGVCEGAISGVVFGFSMFFAVNVPRGRRGTCDADQCNC